MKFKSDDDLILLKKCLTVRQMELRNKFDRRRPF